MGWGSGFKTGTATFYHPKTTTSDVVLIGTATVHKQERSTPPLEAPVGVTSMDMVNFYHYGQLSLDVKANDYLVFASGEYHITDVVRHSHTRRKYVIIVTEAQDI